MVLAKSTVQLLNQQIAVLIGLQKVWVEDGGVTSIQQVSTEIPVEYKLFQNFPNPFNPSTNLGFGISELGFVTLKVYDVLGNEVSTLVNENLSPGSYEVEFNGNNFPSGVYFYKLSAGEYSEVKRMILLK